MTMFPNDNKWHVKLFFDRYEVWVGVSWDWLLKRITVQPLPCLSITVYVPQKYHRRMRVDPETGKVVVVNNDGARVIQ